MAKIKNPLIVVKKTSGGGAAYRITTAELPATTINLLQNGTIIDTKTTDATTGGKVSFDVEQLGTYEVQAIKNGATLWTNSVTVNNIGEFIVKSGKSLDEYTDEEIHTTCINGYANIMFEVGLVRKFVDTNSIFNNLNIFIEDIVSENGKDYIDWRLCDQINTSYDINPKIGYITSNSASSFLKDGFSYGGEKYSAMQRRMMSQGEAVFSQATGILPDDYSGSLTTGIKFSDLKYTDNSLGNCSIYSYNCKTDEMTLLTTPLLATPSNTAMMFIEGYFESVGILDEATFNAGNYYTYDSLDKVYTKATTYSSDTIYYALYKTMQTDGVFVSALSSKKNYLIKTTLSASAGGSQTSKLSSFSAYANLPCIENMFGVNRTSILKSGLIAPNADAYNLANEGSKLKIYNDWSVLVTGKTYWTRSTCSNNTISFGCVNINGYIANTTVFTTRGARVGFRTC